jgi:hypothetical protein
VDRGTHLDVPSLPCRARPQGVPCWTVLIPSAIGCTALDKTKMFFVSTPGVVLVNKEWINNPSSDLVVKCHTSEEPVSGGQDGPSINSRERKKKKVR